MTTTSPNQQTVTKILRLVSGALLSALMISSARADENNFGYVYGSETLPQGETEIYQWVTHRTGKEGGSYDAFDFQTEIEHGFTNKLQGSLYLNAISHDVDNVPGFTDRDQFRFNGAQASLKYSLRSPYKDSYGLAVYVEPGYKRYSRKSGKREDIFFFETKLIHQKNLMDGSLTWATNLTAELEREHDLAGQSWETELELKLSSGLSYRIAPSWFVGIEGLITSAYESAHLDKLGEYGIFLGPNLHYASKRWWFTLTVFPQITGWPETGDARNLNNFEKLETRLKIGITF